MEKNIILLQTFLMNTYFSRTIVLTVPSTSILRTRLKSPTNIDPSGAAAKATGASNLCLDA